MLRQSLDPSKLMDPRKVLMKRYQMMGLHLGMIIALIAVSATEVRSAILLGIHGTSCLFFLIYIPRAAYLSYKRSRTRETTMELAKGGREMEGGARGKESRWDAAAAEVGYLGWQCSTTLVSSVLCTLSLRSDQCYGRSHWALDEFAEIKERDVDDWCQGVIGATVLSYVQFVLDMTWLGWVVWLARSAGDVVVVDGDVDVELRRRAGAGARDGEGEGRGDVQGRDSEASGSRTLTDNDANRNNNSQDTPTPTHAQKVLAALRMPVPLILLKLAAHRSEQEMIRLEGIIARNRERMNAARYAPMRNLNNVGERRVEPEGTEHLEAGENIAVAQPVFVHADYGYGHGRVNVTGPSPQVYAHDHNDARSHGADHDHGQRPGHPQTHAHGPGYGNAHTPDVAPGPDRDTRLGYREVPPPYIGREGGAPGYVTPGRELDERVFFGNANGDGAGRGGRREASGAADEAAASAPPGTAEQVSGVGGAIHGPVSAGARGA